jgi:symplekin
MSGGSAATVEMISQLEAARKLALGDPQVYNQVVPGIVGIIGPAAALEVRRWGAEFMAECFASPASSSVQKQQLSSEVIPLLKSFLDNPAEDSTVVRSVVQTVASIYPLVFRRMYVRLRESLFSS